MSAESDRGSKLTEIPISIEEYVPSLEAVTDALIAPIKNRGSGAMEDVIDALNYRIGERGLSRLMERHEGANPDFVKQAIEEAIAKLQREIDKLRQ